MKYKIALYKSEEGYAVSVPGLLGCWSQGTTEQEAVENIREAIREYLGMEEDFIVLSDEREGEIFGDDELIAFVDKGFFGLDCAEGAILSFPKRCYQT